MGHVVTARELIALRRTCRRRTFSASEVPESAASAYETAAAVLGLLGEPTAAWKLGATNAKTREVFGTDEVYFGGLAASEVWHADVPTTAPCLPVFKAEAEIALRLAHDIPNDPGRSLDEVLPDRPFDAWAPSLEAPYSCVENLPDAGLAALLMDRCAAGALFLGSPRGDVDDDAMNDRIEILAAGITVAAADTSALLMSPAEAALAFLTIARTAGFALRKGQWIATGGLTACVPLPHGEPVELRFAGKSVFSVVVSARRTGTLR
jgi:2-keto-4-pentenoate hydratase